MSTPTTTKDSKTPDAPPAPEPTAADGKPRTAPEKPQKAPKTPKTAPPPVTDPEAPFGWMVDPETGQKRPKKRPGRQAKPGSVVTPPPSRGAPRVTKTPAPAKTAGAKDYTGPVNDLVNSVWMIGASLPPVLGESADIKVKAQTAIIRGNQPGLVTSISLAATHVPTIARGVDYLTSGPVSWIIPATFALLPFVAQSATVWRSDPAGLIALSDSTKAEWGQMVAAMTEPAEPTPEASKDEHANK